MLSESECTAHIFCEKRILTLPKRVLPQAVPATNRRAYCSLTPSLLPRLHAPGYITATTNAYFTIYLRHSRASEPQPTERAERRGALKFRLNHLVFSRVYE